MDKELMRRAVRENKRDYACYWVVGTTILVLLIQEGAPILVLFAFLAWLVSAFAIGLAADYYYEKRRLEFREMLLTLAKHVAIASNKIISRLSEEEKQLLAKLKHGGD